MKKGLFNAAVLAAGVALAGCNQTMGGLVRPDSEGSQTPTTPQAPKIEPMARPAQSGLYLDKYCEETLKYRSDAGKILSTVANTVTNLDDTCIGIHVGHKDKATGKIDQNREVSSVYGHIWLNACQGRNAASSALGAVVGFLDKRTQIEQQKEKKACDTELKAVESFTAAVIKNMEVKFPGKARGEKLVHDIEGTADLTNFIIPSAIRGRMPDVGSFVPQIQTPSIPSIPNGYGGRPAPSRSRD
ncbi:MAG: hypothetical protein PHX61_11490 [Alphaproteobacteria bacterium]|nr:hypothetical protein [Alphaproteobacteria bacterium]